MEFTKVQIAENEAGEKYFNVVANNGVTYGLSVGKLPFEEAMQVLKDLGQKEALRQMQLREYDGRKYASINLDYKVSDMEW